MANKNLCYVCGLRGKNVQVDSLKCYRCLTLEDLPGSILWAVAAVKISQANCGPGGVGKK